MLNKPLRFHLPYLLYFSAMLYLFACIFSLLASFSAGCVWGFFLLSDFHIEFCCFHGKNPQSNPFTFTMLNIKTVEYVCNVYRQKVLSMQYSFDVCSKSEKERARERNRLRQWEINRGGKRDRCDGWQTNNSKREMEIAPIITATTTGARGKHTHTHEIKQQ